MRRASVQRADLEYRKAAQEMAELLTRAEMVVFQAGEYELARKCRMAVEGWMDWRAATSF